MVGVFAAAGLATTLGWAAAAVPAAQADDSTTEKVTNVVTTSRQAEAWQEIGINADWTADSPKAGQTLTVDLGNGLRWASGVDFKLVKKGDDSVDLGDCTAEINSKHLTCTLNSTGGPRSDHQRADRPEGDDDQCQRQGLQGRSG